MSKIDFAAINGHLLADAENYLREWLPDGRRSGHEFQALNPMRQDGRVGSFSINLETGVWKDFATGDGGADLISLYAYLNNLSQGDAAKALAERLGGLREPPPPSAAKRGRPAMLPVFPIPLKVPPLPDHFRYGKASKIWAYKSAAGELLFYVCRFDPADGKKQFCPLIWAINERTRTAAWHFGAPPAPRPLYGLDKLTANAAAPVVVCEGEKAADAATVLMPDYIAVCSMGGAAAGKKSDWGPLQGHPVFLWPDNDDPGRRYAAEISARLAAAGIQVQWVKIPADKPDGWDAADALSDGWTAASVRKAIEAGEFFTVPELGRAASRQELAPPAGVKPPFDPAAPPWPAVANWHLDETGVRDSEQRYICYRPLWVEALTEDIFERWGVQLKFFDHDWKLREVTLPARILHEQGGILGRELQDMGLAVVPGKEKMLARYLNCQQYSVSRRMVASTRLGWYDNPEGEVAFILPSRVIGATRKPVAYQPESYSRTIDNLRHGGGLSEWQTHVRDAARGNPFLMFALMIGLAGPMLKLARVENGGFNFYGVSTGGKTTMGQVCASVWGCAADPALGPEHTIIQSWDATASAMENHAEMLNDLGIVLDEIGKADPHEVGKSIYKITGGMAKGRSSLGGVLRIQKTWRLLVLSTGEISIKQVFQQFQSEMKAGQRVRFPDIPVDDEDGRRAIIQDWHGAAKAADFVDALKHSCGRYFGVAGPLFVEYLIARVNAVGFLKFSSDIAADLAYMHQGLCRSVDSIGKVVDLGLPEELVRVVKRFALVGLAGYYASAAGILNWEISEIVGAVRVVRDAWLTEQGEARSEVERAVAHLASGIGRHVARFVPMLDKPNAGMRDVLGYRAQCELSNFFVLPEKGLRELCGEYDAQTVLRELRRRRLLACDAGKLTKKCPAIPALGNTRPYLYWISARIFGEEESEPATSREELDSLPGVLF